MKMSKRMGANVVLDPHDVDLIAEVKKLTGGGADVAIEALGLQKTFENCLRCLRAGGTLSSLGVYSGKLQVPYNAFAAGIGDYRIITTLCPGGKERMRRLMSMVQSKRFDPTPLLTHKFSLDQIVGAYDLFGSRRDGVLKVAIRP
jgi:alcohol dehydrogenase